MGEPQSILGSCTGKATCLVNVWEVPEQEERQVCRSSSRLQVMSDCKLPLYFRFVATPLATTVGCKLIQRKAFILYHTHTHGMLKLPQYFSCCK